MCCRVREQGSSQVIRKKAKRKKHLRQEVPDPDSLSHARTHTDLVGVNSLPVQWAADWHISSVYVNGEETFGILVSTGACQPEDMILWLLCWNHLQTHTQNSVSHSWNREQPPPPHDWWRHTETHFLRELVDMRLCKKAYCAWNGDVNPW